MEENSKSSNYSANKTNIVNLVNVVYDDELVLLINSLSKSIKDYYKLTKKSLVEINSLSSTFSTQTLFTKCLTNEIVMSKSMNKLSQLADNIDIIIENKNSFDSQISNLDNSLKLFFDEVRKIFKQMKTTRNQKIDDYLNNKTIVDVEKKDCIGKTYSARYNVMNTPNYRTKLLEDRDNISTPKPNSRSISASSRKLRASRSVEKLGPKNTKINTQANCSLALKVVQFLTEMLSLQDCIMRKTQNVQEKKVKFEKTKNELRKMAQSLLTNDYMNSFNVNNYHYNAVKQLTEENKKKSIQITKNISQIEKLKNEIVDIVNENNTLKVNLQQLSSVTMSSVEQDQLIKSLKMEISSLKTELKEKNYKITDLIDQIANDQTKNELDNLKIEYTLLEENFNQIHLEFEDMKKKYTKTQKDLNEISLKYTNEKEKSKSLENQVFSKEVLINKYTKDLNALQLIKEKNANKSIQKNLVLNQKNNEINQLNEQNSFNQVVISNLKNDVNTLQQTLKTNVETINKINKMNIKLNELLKKKTDEVEKLKREIETMNSNNDNKDKKVEAETFDNEEYEVIKKQLEEENKKLQNEGISIKEKLDELTKENQELKNKMKNLNEQYEKDKSVYKTTKEKLKEVEHKLIEKQIEINDLNLVITNSKKKQSIPSNKEPSKSDKEDSYRKEIEELKGKIIRIEEKNRKEVRNIQDNNDKRIRDYNKERENLLSKISSLESSNNDERNKAISLSKELDKEKDNNNNLLLIKQNLEGKIETLLGKENEVAILNKQISELKEELNKTFEEMTFYKKKIKENDSTIKKLKDKQNLSVSSGEVDNAKEIKIKQYLSKIEEIKLINKSLEDKISIFKSEKQSDQEKIKTISSELEMEKKMNTEFLSKIKILNEEKEHLNKDINELQEEVEKKEKEIKVLKEEIDNNKSASINNQSEDSNAQIHFLKEQKEFFESSVKELKEKVFDLEKELAQKEKESKEYKEQIENLNNEINSLQENKKTEISIIQDEFKNAKKEIEDLKKQLSNNPSVNIPYSSETHIILANKIFNNLTWYLLSLKDEKEHNYNNCIWIPKTSIESELSKYNKFRSEEEEQNMLIQMYTSKLEKKEDELSKLSYNLEKIRECQSQKNPQSNNSSFSKQTKSKISDNKIIVKDYLDLTGQNNTNSEAVLIQKYNSLLNKLSENEIQMSKMQQENIRLNNELKGKINEHNNSSIADEVASSMSGESRKTSERDMKKIKEKIKLLKEERGDFERQLVFIKEQYKELDAKYNKLVGEIKELFVVMQVNSKTKEIVKNICKLIDYSDPDISTILKDQEKKKGFFGFLK